MIKISTPISSYLYYTENGQIVGLWHGQLPEVWNLQSAVTERHFNALAEGIDPLTGEALIRHQRPHEYTAKNGEIRLTREHLQGYDLTFSAPKSVSLVALVNEDSSARRAHTIAVDVALAELQPFVQAHRGGNHLPETTGNWAVAVFEHETARPVRGYAAPQLHSHAVLFNVTQTADGRIRPLSSRELYRSQQYATTVYRSTLAHELVAAGYEIYRGKYGQPEIAGYSQEQLDAASPRTKQIQEHIGGELHKRKFAALATREKKTTAQEQQQQPIVVRQTQPRERVVSRPTVAVDYAVARNIERSAVIDERVVLRDALARSMGEHTVSEIRAEVNRRVESGELLLRSHSVSRRFTTPEMVKLERQNIAMMLEGQGQAKPLAAADIRRDVEHYAVPNVYQRAAIEQILSNRDVVQAFSGDAGVGKTTALGVIRDLAEREGYQVRGLAPVSSAVQELQKVGIDAMTLQQHLTHDKKPEGVNLFVLDESSLTSTTQMHTFLKRLNGEDRVLLVGDSKQHDGVEAGRPFKQLQDAGISITSLEHIVRQQEPALREVVERLAKGDIHQAINLLDTQGRVHEVPNLNDRYQAIADEYLKAPERTLVVSPDNKSRVELNQEIHSALMVHGHVQKDEHPTSVLVNRQELTSPDKQWAQMYQVDDILRHTRGSKGVKPGTYARVVNVHAEKNEITVQRDGGAIVSYDPRRLSGVTVYREVSRDFAVGDRVQFTAPDRRRSIANRNLATIEKIDAQGIELKLGERSITIAPNERKHLEYGYTMTSYSSQSKSVDMVIANFDTARLGPTLLNQQTAYVALSRGREDIRIYTDDREALVPALSREVKHETAIEQGQTI